MLRMYEVRGSNPLISTRIFINRFVKRFFLFETNSLHKILSCKRSENLNRSFFMFWIKMRINTPGNFSFCVSEPPRYFLNINFFVTNNAANMPICSMLTLFYECFYNTYIENICVCVAMDILKATKKGEF